MKRIVIASGNKGKIVDFQAVFKEYEIIPIKTLIPDFDPEETEDTFHGNATLKSEYAAARLNLPVISDDSGLSVKALDGAPGVYSARYSGIGATDKKNNEKLLKALEGIENRSAYFTSVIALSIPGEETRTYEGRLCGEILESPEGDGGFGYDPLFKTDEGVSLGTISPDEKAQISHRRRALDELRKDEELFKILTNS